MSAEATDQLVCHSYTHGRRHPMVVGRVGGWTLPTPLSPAQLLVGMGTFSVLAATRGVWQPLAPGMAKLLVLAGMPIAAGWAVRHARVEGRSPLRAALGLLRLALMPGGGVVRGRPHPRRRAHLVRARIHVATSCVDGPVAAPAVRGAPTDITAPAGAGELRLVRGRADGSAPDPPAGAGRWSCLQEAA